MNIQIIADQEILINDELLIQRVESLLVKIKRDFQSIDFLWTLPKEKYLVTDLYFQIVSYKIIEIGFLPSKSILSVRRIFPYIYPEDLHWVSVQDETPNNIDFLTELLLFVIGMTCLPSQIGSFMSDLADLKIALQRGAKAKYIIYDHKSHEYCINNHSVSSIMLLNEDLPIKNKLKIIEGIIPRCLNKNNHLNILNFTQVRCLPISNMLLLVYKN